MNHKVANWMNYYALVIVIPLYMGLGLAFVIPPPWNGVPFYGGFGFTMVTVVIHPKAAKWIAGARGKQKWIIPDSDETAWSWPEMFQVWYRKDPAMTTQFIHATHELQTYMELIDPISHPFYNGRRKILGVFFRHGLYSFNSMGLNFTDKEIEDLANWDRLFPDKGGHVLFTGMWVWQNTSDRMWVSEIMPSAKEQLEAQEAIAKRQTLLNHVPIIMDGIAYPVFRIVRATGSQMIEKSLRNRQAVAINKPLRNGEAGADIPIMMIKVKKKQGGGQS